MGHYRPIFLFFSYFQQLTVHEILYRILLMIGFEPRTSAIRMRTLPLEPQPLPYLSYHLALQMLR